MSKQGSSSASTLGPASFLQHAGASGQISISRTPSPSADRAIASAHLLSSGAPISSASVFSNAQQAASAAAGAGAAAGAPGASLLVETLGRRLSSFAYLKRTLMGKNVWLGTTRLSKRELDGIYEPEKMKKRSHRAMLVGLSLGPLLDIPTLTEFVRSVLAVISEIDSMPDPSVLMSNTACGVPSNSFAGAASAKGAGSVRNFFSRGTVKRPRATTFDLDKESSSSILSGFSSASGATGPVPGNVGGADHNYDQGALTQPETASSFLGTGAAAGDAAVIGMHLPFTLDYYQTFLTLLDVLSEIYSKGLSFVSTNGAPSSTPGLPSQSAGYFSDMGASSSALASTPSGLPAQDNITATQVELVMKMDGKLKKHITQVSKEIDTVARHVAKTELDGLDSLMKDAVLSPSLTSPTHASGATTPRGAAFGASQSNHSPLLNHAAASNTSTAGTSAHTLAKNTERALPLQAPNGARVSSTTHPTSISSATPHNADAASRAGQGDPSVGTAHTTQTIAGANVSAASAPALQSHYHPRDVRQQQVPSTSGPARTEHAT